MTHYLGQHLGQYRVTRLLGQGGFAEVYLGEHVYLKTPAAIKVLHHRLAGSEDLTGFLQEAQMVARLAHPSIVRVLDFGVERETPFLVMEYASNGTLRQRHPRGERLPLVTIISYIEQVAQALQYAHDEKVIHRDIKPENMLLGQRQQVVLSDFGIALVAQSSRYQSTQEVIGTVAYMAPEQIQGKPRPASDQYALGIVVYEWLCGNRPFSGSFTELCTQHLFAPVPSLREHVPTIAPEVEHVVTTALAKDPKERFGSMQAFAVALKAASTITQGPVRLNPSLTPTILPLVPSTRPGIPSTQAVGSAVAATRPAAGPATKPGPLADLPPLPFPESAPAARRRKHPRRTLVGIVLALLLLAGIGTPILLVAHNDSIHRQALLSAYQALIRHSPDIEYMMHDQNSQLAWQSSDPTSGTCTFVAQGLLITPASPAGFGGPCEATNGLPDNPTTNLLVQVLLSVQKEGCGELAVSDEAFNTLLCSDGSGGINSNARSISAIHQGLNVENSLALEVIAGQNDQIQLIAFMNGQYIDEQSTTQSQFESGTLFLQTFPNGTSTEASALFQDVKVWRVSNQIS